MSANVRERIVKDGMVRVYVDIYQNGEREIQYVGVPIRKTSHEHKEFKRLANQMVSKINRDMLIGKYNLVDVRKKKRSVIEYFENYIKDNNPHKGYISALQQLKKFVVKLSFEQINKKFLSSYVKFLQRELKPNSVANYYFVFTHILKDSELLDSRVFDIKNKPLKEDKKVKYLELHEINLLITSGLNTDIKRAFIFSCYTGLRQGDVRELRWNDIQDNKIVVKQQKTGKEVEIPLSNVARRILDTKIKNIDKIFNLPYRAETILKKLRMWFEEVGIEKRAIYHLSRSTFAVMAIQADINVYVVSKLLGHSSVKITEKHYADVIDKTKEEAIRKLDAL